MAAFLCYGDSMIVIPILLFFLFLFGYFFYKHYSHKVRRNLTKKKYEQNRLLWNDFLTSQASLFSELTTLDKDKLLNSILVFYSEKNWHESIEEEQRILTSYYACLPIFKRKTNYYPSIKSIDHTWPFEKWLEFNEKQFEIDFGKLALKEMNGDFSKLSLMYFERAQELESSKPLVYENLNKFYRLRD
ncbi:zinc-dependent peptidase [Bacteriovorax sp. BAL6_X]|uniref:zinc-dependent peptidase n=1 Tax=Bacteriovorax sp. BAL6_X TaxID=1201290 RepID=UPI0012ED4AAA|nr:zinc-dependent peptidase [Bacteriovorax sp. BAL6_X]